MITTTKNTVLVEFSDGQKHKYKTKKTIPQIRRKFAIGNRFLLQDEPKQIRVEALTIY